MGTACLVKAPHSLLVLACLCALARAAARRSPTSVAHASPSRHRRRHAHHPRPARGQRPGASVHACHGAGLIPLRDDLGRIRAAVLCLVNRERARHGERAAAGEQAPAARRPGSHPEHGLRRLLRPRRPPRRNASQQDARGRLPARRPQSATKSARTSPGAPAASPRRGRSSPPGWPRRCTAPTSSTRASATPAVGVSPHLPGAFSAGGHGGIYTQDFGTVVR